MPTINRWCSPSYVHRRDSDVPPRAYPRDLGMAGTHPLSTLFFLFLLPFFCTLSIGCTPHSLTRCFACPQSNDESNPPHNCKKGEQEHTSTHVLQSFRLQLHTTPKLITLYLNIYPIQLHAKLCWFQWFGQSSNPRSC